MAITLFGKLGTRTLTFDGRQIQRVITALLQQRIPFSADPVGLDPEWGDWQVTVEVQYESFFEGL